MKRLPGVGPYVPVTVSIISAEQGEIVVRGPVKLNGVIAIRGVQSS